MSKHPHAGAHDAPSFKLASLQTVSSGPNSIAYVLCARTASFFMAAAFAVFGLMFLLLLDSEKTAVVLLAFSAWVVWAAVCRPPMHLSSGTVTFEQDGLHQDSTLLVRWEDVRTVNVTSTLGLPVQDTFGRERVPHQTNVNVGVRKRGVIEFGLPELQVDDEHRTDKEQVRAMAEYFRVYATSAKVCEFTV